MPIMSIKYSLIANAHAERTLSIDSIRVVWIKLTYIWNIIEKKIGQWWISEIRSYVNEQSMFDVLLLLCVWHTIMYNNHDKRRPNANNQCIHETHEQFPFFTCTRIEYWLWFAVGMTFTMLMMYIRFTYICRWQCWMMLLDSFIMNVLPLYWCYRWYWFVLFTAWPCHSCWQWRIEFILLTLKKTYVIPECFNIN
jgi:hypothetical protein